MKQIRAFALAVFLGGCAIALNSTGTPSADPSSGPSSGVSASPDASPSADPSADPTPSPSPTPTPTPKPTAPPLLGYVTTLAGSNANTLLPPGATSSIKLLPVEVGVAANGDMFVLNNRWGGVYNAELLKISGGMVTVVAESSGSAHVVGVRDCGIHVDHSGDVYLCDSGTTRIWKIGPDGQWAVFAGHGPKVSEAYTKDGKGGEARFSYPVDSTRDAEGNFYILESARIRKMTPDGTVSTIGPASGLNEAVSIAMHPSGDLWVASAAGVGVYSSVDGAIVVPPKGYKIYHLKTDKYGNLFGWTSSGLFRIPPGGTWDEVQLVFGFQGPFADGPFGTAAGIIAEGAAVDSNGDIVVADRWSGRVRKVVFQR